jgi:hypothetical protein
MPIADRYYKTLRSRVGCVLAVHFRTAYPLNGTLLSSSGCITIFLETKTMSQIPPTTTSSTNFQCVFNAAFEAYENKTRNKLLTHPLAAKLQTCDSPAAILSVLEQLVEQFDQQRSNDERLRKWLNPTVNVIYAFSATIAGGISLVSPKM